MEQGEKSLALELERRRAGSDNHLAAIPQPPGPARLPAPLLWLFCATMVLAVGACAILLFRSPATR
jgi:hypothetical protein